MSIANEIQRLQTAKANIKAALELKGVTVPSTATLDEFPQLIEDNLREDKRLTQYLTFKVIVGGDIKWNGSTTANTLSYSKDNGNTWTTANSADTISVSPLDKVMWKGTPTPQTDIGIGTFSGDTNVKYEVEGNAMSLLFGDNFIGQKSFSGKDYAFYWLFSGNTNVVSIENLSLPATTLSEACYRYMFRDCTSLVSVPSDLLPATTLAVLCYNNMFRGTSLTTIPSNLLHATTLADSCYQSMFAFCTSLTTIPSNLLPATTLVDNCYRSMFYSCTSLTTVPSDMLPATTLTDGCYREMFYMCSSLTTTPLLPATTLADSCYLAMFYRCSSLTTTPLLPATTLADTCYRDMFGRCSSLTTVPSDMLPATTLADNCYKWMFGGCSSLTTTPLLPATTLVDNCYKEMFMDCPLVNNITCFATDISATDCTLNWTLNVAASGTFTKASSMSSWTTGANGIPDGWTVQNAS